MGYMTKCYRCRTKIYSHLWLVGERAYCSPSCERNGKSQFEKLYRALASFKKED